MKINLQVDLTKCEVSVSYAVLEKFYIYFLASCKFTICNCIFWKFELDLPFNLSIHLILPVANCRMAQCTEDKTFQNAIRILLTIPQGPLPAAHWSDVADLSLIWCPCPCTNSMDPDVPVAILLFDDYCGIIKTILEIDGKVRPFGHVVLCGVGVSQPTKGLWNHPIAQSANFESSIPVTHCAMQSLHFHPATFHVPLIA